MGRTELPSKRKQSSFPPPFVYEREYSSFQSEWEMRHASPCVDTTCIAYSKDHLIMGNSEGQISIWKEEEECVEETKRWLLVRQIVSKTGTIFFFHIADDNSIFIGGTDGFSLLENCLGPEKSPCQFQELPLVHAQANEKFVYVVTRTQKLITLRRSDLKQVNEIRLLENRRRLEDKVTALHLTAASILLIGTNFGEIICFKTDGGSPKRLQPLSFSNDSRGFVVTAITSNVNDWWTIAGFESDSHRAYIGTFHGPTRSQTRLVGTRENIQGLWVEQGKDTLYSVGNEGFITVWENIYRLKRIHRIRVTAQSNKVIVGDGVGRLFVGGIASNKVDVIANHVCTESLHTIESNAMLTKKL